MSYITTFTGKHIDPLNPDSERIDIRDIAHALSLTCRGNGHVKTFFSVAQHCINCALEAEARGYSKRVVLSCLLHDAGEAYLSDVPRPLKSSFIEYRNAEAHLLDMIYAKFLAEPLTEEEKKRIKDIDDNMLYYDLIELLGETPAGTAPELATALNYEVIPFAEVENAYLEMYERLKFKDGKVRKS
ncbi:MAG: hypothetical protein E7269_05350 [Lachnospiraceae bacterium]|nr:hypothetical protein [Lachnospiraceae bacterium]